MFDPPAELGERSNQPSCPHERFSLRPNSALSVGTAVSTARVGHNEAMTDVNQARGSTKERLMAAAIDVVGDVGVNQARASEIARRAGLTTGAIYSNYRTKEELIAAAMLVRHEQLFQEALGTGGPGIPLSSTLIRILTSNEDSANRVLLEVAAAASRDPDLGERFRMHLQRRVEAISELVDAEKRSGRISQEIDTASLSYLLNLIGLGNVFAQALQTPRPDGDAIESTLSRLGAAILALPADPDVPPHV